MPFEKPTTRMRDDIRSELQKRLAADYRFEGTGDWLQKGKCPQCGKKELYTRREAPWVISCGRKDKCGWDANVKDLYPDIFDHWSNRFKADEENPTAAADAYLSHARRFDLRGLRDCYTQESFSDGAHSSATVRFPLPGGSWWERLIDQPGRFDKKANFAKGKSYQGQWWAAPDHDLEALARAPRIWIAEGIFDALSFRQVGEAAASAMSCYNYPEKALADLRRKVAELDLGGGPQLIFAFDVGKAGREYSRKFAERARKEGWNATAASVKPEGDDGKLDWNDLLLRGRLTTDDLAEYLWQGEVMIAPSATEKACLIYHKHGWASFPLVHDSRTWWASFNRERIAEVMTKEQVTEKAAARACANVEEIANCAFRILYFQRDPAIDESHYYLRVDTPEDRNAAKAAFSPAALSAAAEFKKRLLGVSPGAQWTGSTTQLDRLIARQNRGIKTVELLDFTGYSREHEAWVLGDIAVKGGRVHRINAEDYFDLGKMSLKLRTNERILSIDYDPERIDTGWLGTIWAAFHTNGLITASFWLLTLFAEQIRQLHKSFPFLEATGDPGTGKSTLIEFLWKTVGRENYEGFDPQKATAAALARNLGKVANLPVVLIEGDRDAEGKATHAKRFEWEELKTAYNGRSVRARGVRNGGNETYEPPFRGGIVIAQNAPVMASQAVLERIVQLTFDKAQFSPATKAAAERLEQWPLDQLSGFIAHAIRREEDLLAAFRTAYARHEAVLEARGDVRNVRLIKNHAQLAAGLDMLDRLAGIPPEAMEVTRERIYRMAAERRDALASDHPVVQRFWEAFDYLESREEGASDDTRINRHRRWESMIAVQINHFEARCRDRGISAPPYDDLKRHLKNSKSRKFVSVGTVNTISDKHEHCWVFERPQSQSPERKAA